MGTTICRTYNLTEYMTEHSCTKQDAIDSADNEMATDFPGSTVISSDETENPETGDDMYTIKVSG